MSDRSKEDLGRHAVVGHPREGKLKLSIGPGLDAVDLSRNLVRNLMEHHHSSRQGIGAGFDLSLNNRDDFLLAGQS